MATPSAGRSTAGRPTAARAATRSTGATVTKSTAAAKKARGAKSATARSASTSRSSSDNGSRDRRAALPGAGEAAQKAVQENVTGVDLPVIGHVSMPPMAHMAFYAGITVLAAVELIEWPVALVIGLGKILADNRTHKSLQDLGDALGEIG